MANDEREQDAVDDLMRTMFPDAYEKKEGTKLTLKVIDGGVLLDFNESLRGLKINPGQARELSKCLMALSMVAEEQEAAQE